MNDNALRTVPLGEIAAYLGCTKQRLAMALRRLAEPTSLVEYGVGEAAILCPATMALYSLPTAEEVQVLEELLEKPDLRSPK